MYLSLFLQMNVIQESVTISERESNIPFRHFLCEVDTIHY